MTGHWIQPKMHLKDLERRQAKSGQDHGGEEQRRPDARQGYVPRQLASAGSVEAGRFVQVLWDTLQPREQDHHGEANVLPDADEDDGGQGQRRILQERDRLSEKLLGEATHEADVRVQEEPPHQPDGRE